jgi:hypothetical protein
MNDASLEQHVAITTMKSSAFSERQKKKRRNILPFANKEHIALFRMRVANATLLLRCSKVTVDVSSKCISIAKQAA